MAEKVWIVAEGGQQKEGKHSNEEVAAMLAENPDGSFLVWKEGMAEWVDPHTRSEFQSQGAHDTVTDVPAPAPGPPPASSGGSDAAEKMKAGGKQLLGKFKDSKDSQSYLPHLKMLDALLGWIGKVISADLLDTLDEWAKKFGHLALILSALLLFAFDVLTGIKTGDFFSQALKGLLIFPAVVVVQYLAYKFLDAGKALIAKSPSNISTKAFFECIALLLLLGAVGSFFGGIVSGIGEKSFEPVAMGIGAAIIMIYSLGVALNRSTVNIHVVDEASAGQEAIGVFSFVMKLQLRLVPFVYGVVNILAPLVLLYTMLMLLIADEGEIFGPLIMGGMIRMAVIGVALLPFAAYLAFLIYYLLLDLIRSILIVPEKLDRLHKGDEDD